MDNSKVYYTAVEHLEAEDLDRILKDEGFRLLIDNTINSIEVLGTDGSIYKFFALLDQDSHKWGMRYKNLNTVEYGKITEIKDGQIVVPISEILEVFEAHFGLISAKEMLF